MEHCLTNEKVLKLSHFSCAELHQDHSKVNYYKGSSNIVVDWVSDEGEARLQAKRGLSWWVGRDLLYPCLPVDTLYKSRQKCFNILLVLP